MEFRFTPADGNRIQLSRMVGCPTWKVLRVVLSTSTLHPAAFICV